MLNLYHTFSFNKDIRGMPKIWYSDYYLIRITKTVTDNNAALLDSLI